jgi:hypothetical protein
MNTMDARASNSTALEWMEMNHLHITREAGEVAGKTMSPWPGIAVVPFLAFYSAYTSSAIGYNVQLDAGHTNPVISMPGEDAADWMDEEGDELQDFLAFLDRQMDSHPEWIAPADEAQLDRLAKLLANVKV